MLEGGKNFPANGELEGSLVLLLLVFDYEEEIDEVLRDFEWCFVAVEALELRLEWKELQKARYDEKQLHSSQISDLEPASEVVPPTS